MTIKDKELLLRDLCGRLPYGVKVQSYSYEDDVETIETLREIDSDGYMATLECETLKCIAKPYLFPLSSMTEEQKEEIEDKLIFPNNSDGGWIEIFYDNKYEIPFWFVDFCNKNHFDYRGLIEKGLAFDATGLNIY